MGTAEKLTEEIIVELVKTFLITKPDGNWHEEKVKQASGHDHGPDLVLVGGKRNSERFIVECKGKSYAKSAISINKEGWLNALGQLVTRMSTARTIQTGKTRGRVNRAYRYGLGLYWIGAQVALRRIPREIAKTMNLYIFSVYDDGFVRQWSPKDFEKKHPDTEFRRPKPVLQGTE
ncbi:MAG: hypothetical protein K6G17_05520 [Oscillospiraceae bacterium]|nr:hypothetical protein [Oscillospiraceae bacterium]